MSKEKQIQNNQDTQTSQRTLVEGSTWMSVGSIVSRLLGALYIIPWMMWMGDQSTANAANALFTIGYEPYGLFLNLATAGIPTAISQQVSHYNAIQEYEISKSIYKRALQIMALTGLVSALAMWFLAPQLSAQSPNASVQDGIVVIRSLVPALLIIPMMSVTRGFLQGHNTMAPSAISQIIEQFARIIFMLSTVYIVRQIMGGTPLTAVALSTFAAFVGAVFSFAYLLYQLKKRKTALAYGVEESRQEVEISTNSLIKSIVVTAIPFIIISIGISLSQQIDQFTYAPIMERHSNLSAMDIQITYGVSHANANKLIMILISFGTAIATASVPLLSQLKAAGDRVQLKQQISNIIQLLMVVIIPGVIGMGVLARPLYALFYSDSLFGTRVTQVSVIVAFFWAFFVILSNILKAIDIVKPIIYVLVAGLVIKLILQLPFVSAWGVYGLLTTTIIAFAFIATVYFIFIQDQVNLDLKQLMKRLLTIFAMAVVMGILVYFVSLGLQYIFPVGRKLNATIVLLVSVAAGVAVYGWLLLKSRLAEKIISSDFAKLRVKLRIK